MTPTGVATPTGAIAPGGMPAAAGGVDVSGAITSVIPGIRKLKKTVVIKAIPKEGGLVQIELPKASYMSRAMIRITGELKVTQGVEKVNLAKVDPRLFINKFEFALSGSTSPRILSGIQSDVIDGLDLPAIAPNLQIYTLPEPAKEASLSKTFSIEMSPSFVVSPQNLYGIPYLGAPSTVPEFNITFGNPDGTLIKKEKPGPTITLENGQVEVYLERIDLPAPVMPRTQVSTDSHGNQVATQIPGQGLYLESGYMILSRMYEEQKPAANGTKLFQLPIGPDYARIIIFAFTEKGVLDPETTPMLKEARLTVQQATAIEAKKPWQFSNEYRHLYNKERPAGVYVFSGIDETGTDADLYVTRELGNFALEIDGTEAVIGEEAKFQVVTQQLVPLSEPGLYL
jgi:hypothetical protein